MSTIKSKQKHCQHLIPYRLHSMSQNLEEAEQLHCSVGGSRSFGTGEQCKSAAAQTGVVYAISSISLTFLTLSPSLGLPAGTASMNGPPSQLLCWPGPHTARGGSGPGCSTALQGSCSALPPGHSGLQEKQRQHLAISAASTCEASGPECQSLALHPVECSQDKTRS